MEIMGLFYSPPEYMANTYQKPPSSLLLLAGVYSGFVELVPDQGIQSILPYQSGYPRKAMVFPPENGRNANKPEYLRGYCRNGQPIPEGCGR